MKLSRRGAEEEVSVAAQSTDEVDLGKGRPTPKRRDTAGVRGPVTAPKTRKEAYARQKAQAKATKTATKTARTAAPGTLTAAQKRTLMKAGDPAVLPKRDQGKTRKLARDYVDSHRMASNYFLLLFPLMVLSGLVKGLAIVQLVTLAAAVGFIVEWFFAGRRIRRMAIERYGEAEGSNMVIGFYAGSRAYLIRKWRLPAPQVALGDEI